MTNSQAFRHCLAVLGVLFICAAPVTAQNKIRIIQTNSSGDNVHIIDPATNKVVGVIDGIEVGRDAGRVYVGIIEQPGGVDVIDTASLNRVKTIPTRGAIHNAYVTPDGKHVVAGSIQGKSINVIDAHTEQPVWTLEMDLGV